MATKTKTKEYRCETCKRRLRNGRWVYSTHTGHRFCLPGKGCQK